MRILALGTALLWMIPGMYAHTLKDVETLVDRQAYDSAITVLQQLEPDGKVRFWQGYLHYLTGRTNAAMVYYYEAIPQLEGAWQHSAQTDLAEILRKSGMAQQALELLYSVRDEAKPTYNLYTLYYNLGVANRDLGRYGDAIIELQLALDHAPNLTKKGKCLNMMGLVLQRDSSFQESIKYFDLVSQESGKYYGKALHNKAMSLYQLGQDPLPQFKEALKYKKGTEKFITLKDIGEVSGDIETLREALTWLPENPEPEYFRIYSSMYELSDDPKYLELQIRESNAYIARIEAANEIQKKYSAVNTLAQYQQNLAKGERIGTLSKVALALCGLVLLALFWYSRQRYLISKIREKEKEVEVLEEEYNRLYRRP